MRKIRIALTAAATLAMVISAEAQTQAPAGRGVMVYWPATAYTCGSWSSALSKGRESDEAQLYTMWMYGFVSGQSLWASRDKITLAATDTAGIDAWITKYCADHPLDTIAAAGLQLVDVLTGGRKVAR